MLHAHPDRLKATTRLVLRPLFLMCTEAVVLDATFVKLSLAILVLMIMDWIVKTPLLKTDLSVASRPPSSTLCSAHAEH